jgi:hypothetical protein
VDDVLGEIVLAGGNENLAAGDLVATVALLDRFRAQQTEVGAAMRLGQVHGAGPAAFHQFRQIFRLQFGRGMGDERGDGALRQAGIHGEGHVGGAEEFIDQLGQNRRQTLAAKFFRHRNADPTTFGQLPVGILEAGGRGDAAIVVARTALLVAHPIERGEHLFREPRGLAQYRLDHIGRGLGKARQIAVAVDMEDVVDQEQGVVHRCLVGGHRFLQASAGARQHALTIR